MANQVSSDLKLEFKQFMAENNCSFNNAFDRLFELFSSYEKYFEKDLYTFTPKEIFLVFKGIAKNLKYTSILTYNSLIKDYKKWVKETYKYNISTDNCSVDMLQTIQNCKQYVILTESDILNLTQYNKIDGANYNIAIFIKLFWEIDGQEELKDILALKIENVDIDNQTVKIYNSKQDKHNEYPISKWLTSLIKHYADLDALTFTDRNGSYKILTAKQNKGYIFRMTWTYRTKEGTPIDGVKFSNLLGQFCDRNKGLTDKITINDLKMSLALRHMVTFKRTANDMYLRQRYFRNLPERVYESVFETLAELTYPIEFMEYIKHYKSY